MLSRLNKKNLLDEFYIYLSWIPVTLFVHISVDGGTILLNLAVSLCSVFVHTFILFPIP